MLIKDKLGLNLAICSSPKVNKSICTTQKFQDVHIIWRRFKLRPNNPGWSITYSAITFLGFHITCKLHLICDTLKKSELCFFVDLYFSCKIIICTLKYIRNIGGGGEVAPVDKHLSSGKFFREYTVVWCPFLFFIFLVKSWSATLHS